jgi:copper chaperone
MTEFSIPNMSCGHCAGAVTRAVQAVDPQAIVEVQLEQRVIKVKSSADQRALVDALAEAGYRPQ